MAAVDLKEALEFDKELHSLYEAKLPVSASKISSLTKLAVKHAKQYKGVVYSIERFITKCPPELKLAGLYVVDSIARAVSKHPEEGESYIARFEERMDAMFPHLMQAPGKDKDRVKRTVGLWRKSKLFSPSVVEQVEKTYLQVEPTPQPSTDALGVLAGLSATSAPAANTNADPRLSGTSSGGASTPVTAAAPANALAGLDASSLLNALNTMNNQASTLPALGGLDLNSLLPLLQGAQQQQQHSTISQLSSLLGLQGASIPGLQPGQLGQAGQIGQLGNLSDLLKSGNSPFNQNGLQQPTTQSAGEGQGGFGASNGNAM
ncbi:hypothetical protein HDU85_003011 [Gaertneriomyces sp. JEL0708]|nr:hypothetical protein HDU85_003011 [Gaertneriomyces sp. JEL0708]